MRHNYERESRCLLREPTQAERIAAELQELTKTQRKRQRPGPSIRHFSWESTQCA